MFLVSFYDEYSGQLAAEPMGATFPARGGDLESRTAAFEEAKKFATASWEDTTRQGETEYASDLEWVGPVGTATYKMASPGGGADWEFAVAYVITAA